MMKNVTKTLFVQLIGHVDQRQSLSKSLFGEKVVAICDLAVQVSPLFLVNILSRNY